MGEQTIILDHEGRLSVIETQIAGVKRDIDENTKVTKGGFKEITNLLKGDNGEGLCTKVAVNNSFARDNIIRLWLVIPLLFSVAITIISYLVA